MGSTRNSDFGDDCFHNKFWGVTQGLQSVPDWGFREVFSKKGIKHVLFPGFIMGPIFKTFWGGFCTNSPCDFLLEGQTHFP